MVGFCGCFSAPQVQYCERSSSGGVQQPAALNRPEFFVEAQPVSSILPDPAACSVQQLRQQQPLTNRPAAVPASPVLPHHSCIMVFCYNDFRFDAYRLMQARA
jgi:hypothetical protein